MTVDNWLDNVVALPEIVALTIPTDQGGPGMNLEDIRDNLGDQVSSVIDEVAGAHEWDFAIEETTTTTVANQASYTLSGADQDAMNIANIRWGDDDDPVVKKTQRQMDDYLSRHTPAEMAYWAQNGRSNGYPVVEFFSAPTTAGETITYRYWRNDVALGEFPAVLDDFLIVSLAKRMIKAYRREYANALATAINAYERGGGEADVAMIDPQIVTQNNRRAEKHGW